MVPDSKVLDDLARVAGGAAGLLSGLKSQVKQDLRERAESVAARLDLVPRDEADRLEAMILALRAEVASLTARVAELEGQSPAPQSPTKKART